MCFLCSGVQIYCPGEVPSSCFAINQSTSRTLQAYQVTEQFSCVCVHNRRRCSAHELDLGDSAPAAFLRSNSRQTLKEVLASSLTEEKQLEIRPCKRNIMATRETERQEITTMGTLMSKDCCQY